jgi:Acetyltransferase (GNAT) family.
MPHRLVRPGGARLHSHHCNQQSDGPAFAIARNRRVPVRRDGQEMIAAVCTIRKARLPNDKPAILEFIIALQRYESFLEPNHLIDHAMAGEYFAYLLERTQKGAIFMAEEDGKPIGWAVVYEEQSEAFIRADERTYAYLAELYLTEEGRGTGSGQKLIHACENWAVENGYASMRIDLLSRNEGAFRAYAKAGYVPYCQEVKKRLLPVREETPDELHIVPLKPVRAKRLPLSAA